NGEQQYYTGRPENVIVENNVCKIIVKNEQYEGFNFTSAKLNSKDSKMFRYGRIEIRAKLSNQGGIWPAFFMFGEKHSEYDYGRWPFCGEIDIMELSTKTPDLVQFHIHAQGGTVPGATLQLPTNSTAFHTYRIDWTPDYIKWFVDGNQVQEYINNNYEEYKW